ncbi:DUF1611 domain-containing protein [Panacibacter sp. DH6]|uniref:DUF1611 domain-containing protein n=1 Tax=Panacibacter microcysteis TaxID=2793269 RepID=A0A931MDB4_9BACT|nr:DUF1611 domain-containing protein [Panacibacter microcysteis]MBG9378278.1 DUF1611 domain-containing protein [Panacibacter microcysteis]
MATPKAIVLTDGLLHTGDAKTAHGLIRGTDRYQVVAVIDSVHAGKDAGEILDGKHRNIPVFANVQTALHTISNVKYCIIGVATVGGAMPKHFFPIIEHCITQGLSIVNGLHEFLSEMPAMVSLAEKHGVTLTDIRKPKPRKELHFWTGEIFNVKAPIIAVIGTDCALGKRTTCRMLVQACNKSNINAQMIYTGQTGWLQGGKYGFVFDTTVNDFISGELEHAIVSCDKDTNPDVILIEGQSALRNPTGPCGSEMLVSGNARYVVLVHAPKRTCYEHVEAWGKIQSPASEIALINMYNAEVIALALNTEDCTTEEALQFREQFEAELGIPVLLPLQQGVEKIVPRIQSLIKEKL